MMVAEWQSRGSVFDSRHVVPGDGNMLCTWAPMRMALNP